jgi:hypothetical protein
MYPQQQQQPPHHTGGGGYSSNNNCGLSLHPLDEMEFEQDDLCESDEGEQGGDGGERDADDEEEEEEGVLAHCLRQRQQNHLSMQQKQSQNQQSSSSSGVYKGPPRLMPPGMPPLSATTNHHYQRPPPNCVPLQGTDSVSVSISSDVCGDITVPSVAQTAQRGSEKKVHKSVMSGVAVPLSQSSVSLGLDSTPTFALSSTPVSESSSTTTAPNDSSIQKKRKYTLPRAPVKSVPVDTPTETLPAKRHYKKRATKKEKEELEAQQRLLEEEGDTLQSLLSLPLLDESTMDSAWGHSVSSGGGEMSPGGVVRTSGSSGAIGNLSNLNFSSMAHAFDEHSHAALSSTGGHHIHNQQHMDSLFDGLTNLAGGGGEEFSNLSQMDSLLFGAEALLSPLAALSDTTQVIKSQPCFSPTRAQKGGERESFAFSPPTTRPGNPTNIKRKIGVGPSPAVSGDAKKHKAGGLFASVMANSKQK